MKTIKNFTFQAIICLSSSHQDFVEISSNNVMLDAKFAFQYFSFIYCNVEFKLILLLILNKLWSNDYTVIEQHLVKSIDFIWFSAFIKSSLRLLCIVATLKHFAAKRHLSVAKCTKWRLLLKTKFLDAGMVLNFLFDVKVSSGWNCFIFKVPNLILI